ncbi:MAG TPA: hypothetical protein VJ915_11880 [Balneolaceae bacterium]|nr:hypothetical protein [Balneolaceae bacterium]
MYSLKTLITTVLALLVTATLFSGCDTLNFEEADKTYDGDNKVKFTNSSVTLFAEEDQDAQSIEVSTLKPESEARTYSFVVVDDELTTAVAGEDYTLTGNEFTIAANEVIGQIPITLIKNSLGDAPTLHLEISDPNVASYNTSVIVTLRQFFPYNQQDFVGEFELVYPWWFGDPQPRVVTTVAGEDENVIIVQNMLDSGTDIAINMDDSDPANFSVSFDKQQAWVSSQFGDVRMFGSGTFDAESFIIEANAEHTVSAGTFGTNPFTMTKITAE